MGEITELKLKSGEKGRQILNKKIALIHTQDNELVIYSVRSMAVKAGFGPVDEYMIATAASELATNILRYAGTGEIEISILEEEETGNKGIEILASDQGPGIENQEMAMREQYSSLSNSLGLGLPSVKRIMDEFCLETIPGKGTRVLGRKWRKHEKS